MEKNEVLSALKSNTATRKGTRLSTTKTYTVTTDGNMDAVLAPQAIKLLEILYSQDVDSWTEKALFDVISKHTEITEKQTPWKIWQFYRGKLIEQGFVVESK
jgi:hypothetical protein